MGVAFLDGMKMPSESSRYQLALLLSSRPLQLIMANLIAVVGAVHDPSFMPHRKAIYIFRSYFREILHQPQMILYTF